MAGGASCCSQWSEQQKPPVDALNGAARAMPVDVRWYGVISCWWRVVLVLLFVGIAGTSHISHTHHIAQSHSC